MLGYMARLGSFQFGIDTASFQELQRASQYRWSGVNRIGRKPAQQFTGSGADTIKLRGTIFPSFAGGLSQMTVMRGQADKGVSLPLVYSDSSVAQFVGNWCITDINETRTVFWADGRPRKIEFDLSLIEYGDDAGSAAALQTALLQQKLTAVAAARNTYQSITGNGVLDQAYSNITGLASGMVPAAGSMIAALNSPLTAIHDFTSELGASFLPAKNAIIEGIDAATGLRGLGETSLALLGDVPVVERITGVTDLMNGEISGYVQSAARSSRILNNVFTGLASGTPAGLSSAIRSASRSVGDLAKLCTNTSISAVRIRETLF